METCAVRGGAMSQRARHIPITRKPESVGINRHVRRGCKSPTGKESSESILTSSLAGGIVRCRSKRRQRYRWAGLLSFEKPLVQDADSIPVGGRQHDCHVNREWH